MEAKNNMEDKTLIQITKKNWKRLNDKKDSGDTFDSVITKLLNEVKEDARK